MKWSLANTDLFRFCLVLMLPAIVACSGATPRSQYHDNHLPMTAYLQPDLDSDGIAEPLVHITVPLRNLVFSKSGGLISGGVEVVVVAWRGEQQVGGAVASESLQFLEWAETKSDSLLTLDVRVPLDKAEAVVLEIRARSLGTSRTWVKRIPCLPEQWRRLPLVFTGWSWNADQDGILNSRRDTLSVDLLTGRVADVEWPGGGMFEDLLITGRDGFELNNRLEIAPVNSQETAGVHRHDIPKENLPFGRYQALARLVSAAESDDEFISSWYPSRDLLVTWINFSSDEIWGLQLKWLDGLCPEERLDSLKIQETDNRCEQWAELWNSKIINSRTELEHLLTILEADHRFDGPRRGGETDQGRAWIRYGGPDHVQYKGNMNGRYRRWEIWQYKDLGMTLTFMDAHGLGEYRLIETDFPSD